MLKSGQPGDLRVANIIEEGKLGGPQVRMVRVAAALRGRAETLIVMPRANSAPFRALCKEVGVPYHVLPLTRITKEWRAALAYILFSPIEVVRLARLFRREGVDLVHASGGSWQVKAVIAARLAGVPSVWHLNDTAMPGWVRRLFRLVQPLANSFIFASHRSRAYYGRLVASGRPEAVVPATVDPSRFDPDLVLSGDDDLIASWGTTPVIGTIANINPVKGLETLIEATAKLNGQVPTLRLVIVGPAYQRQRGYAERLRKLAAKLGVTAEWVGARADVRPLLRRMDVYICSSLAESSPVSVWEAMAMARPVVSTDVGDVARHLRDGESGFIVPVGDAEAMAKRIGRLLDEPELCARMGRTAREIAKSTFSPGAIADKTLYIYKQVLDVYR